MEEEAREQSTGPRGEGKATRGQGSTYRYVRLVRVDQLSGRVPLREGFLYIHLQKRRPWEGEEGGQQGEGERSKERKERKEKTKQKGCTECKQCTEGLQWLSLVCRRKGSAELAGGEGGL